MLLQVNGFEPDNPAAELARVLEEMATRYAPRPGGTAQGGGAGAAQPSPPVPAPAGSGK